MIYPTIKSKLSLYLWLTGLLVLLLLGLSTPAGAAPPAEVDPAELLQFTSGGHILGFAPDGVYAATGSHAYRVEFVDAAVTPVADTPTGDGDSGALPLSRVTYPNLWPGINLTYDAGDGIVRSTYTLAPGADPSAICLRYNAPVTIAADGSLRIGYETGELRESAPLAWQEIDGRRVPVEPDEVFYLEAAGDETEVRTRGRRRLRDVRSLAELAARFPKGLFVLVHRSAAVNVDRVAEVRRRADGRDWELRLEPPVNRVVPVARRRVAALWAAYGDEVRD